MAGILRSNCLHLNGLWRYDPLVPKYFRAVMPQRRFYPLLRALWFDDISTKSDRKFYDKLAAIRMIFDVVIERCQNVYSVRENCTIDEMLEGFSDRCNLRQYVLNKTNKYDIKIKSLADSRTFSTSKMEVYAETLFRFENKPSSIVKRMILPICKMSEISQ